MAMSTRNFAIIVSIIMATPNGGNCQITGNGPGFDATISLLQNVTSTLQNQEGLHVVTNIILQNSSATADDMASMLPEIILLLQDQWKKENEYRNNTIDVLQSQLDNQQDNHNETKAYLQDQQQTLTQMVDTQTQTLNKLSQIAETQTLMANTFSQVVALLQTQSQQLHNISSTMNTMVSVLENQQKDVQNISHSVPIVLDQQATEIKLLNQQLMTTKSCCLEVAVNDGKDRLTTSEMTTEETSTDEDVLTTEEVAITTEEFILTTTEEPAAPTCPPDEFFCADGACVSKDWACDGFEDCADGSDEDQAFCATCPFQFLCSNGLCRDTGYVCDGRNQCRDNSDETQICNVALPSPSVGDIGTRSVTLNWDDAPPTLDSNPPRNITQYAVTLTTQDGGPLQTVYIPAEGDTNYTITGLRPETMYDVEIAAVVKTEGQSEPEVYNNIDELLDGCHPLDNNLGVTPFTFETTSIPTTEAGTTERLTTVTAPTCPPDKFLCTYGTCVYNDWTCDGFEDCADGSDEDEAFCATCPFQFLCSNGLCTDTGNVCDGRDQCRDNSDETQICDVALSSPSVGEIGTRSVTLNWDDAPPTLDSNPPRNITHYEVTLTPQDGGDSQTVYVPVEGDTNYTITGLRPDTMYDVQVAPVVKTEGQSEPVVIINLGVIPFTFETIPIPTTEAGTTDSVTTVTTTTAPTCPPDEYFCADGTCVYKDWACDGFEDCADGSDEDEAFCATCPYQFLCSNGLCTDTGYVCDGRDQCRDNSDETEICNVPLPSPSVDKIRARSITLYWYDAPTIDSNPSRNITQYAVTLTPKDGGPLQTVYVPAKGDTNYTITGLRPETMYEVEVAPVVKTEGQLEPEVINNLGLTPFTFESITIPTTKAGTTESVTSVIGTTVTIPTTEAGTTESVTSVIGTTAESTTTDSGATTDFEAATCPPDEFLCGDGTCVSKDWACDGFESCSDGSDEDEAFCATCPFQFYCLNGRCTDRQNVCDGINQCGDNSDETKICDLDLPLPSVTVVGISVTLSWNEPPPALGSNPTRNITHYAVTLTPQDGGPSQTVYVPAEAGTNYTISELTPSTMYNIETHAVIATEGQGEPEPYDLGIPTQVFETLSTCPPDKFFCADGPCVFKDWACDMFEDCTDGSDEDDAFCATCPFKFLCSNGQCIDKQNVCDGINQCRDNSDETQFCGVDIPSPSVANVGIGVGSVVLSWDEPPPTLDSNPPRNITLYDVTLTPQDGGPSQTVYVPTEAGTNYTITGLKQGTMYDIETRVVIETEGQGDPEPYDLGIPPQVFTPFSTCPPDKFFCADGPCVFKDWACDMFEDCTDGSDEDDAFCATCPFKFLCSNGQCIDKQNVCDGINQCRDNSDETQFCGVVLIVNKPPQKS
ncbi:uncharacterized protein [Amphiura filiformis]|uniref:uncharacterized protein n=1 Tax=Amphiura filiformis TaxID=82378 RepID=UPI003B22109C